MRSDTGIHHHVHLLDFCGELLGGHSIEFRMHSSSHALVIWHMIYPSSPSTGSPTSFPLVWPSLESIALHSEERPRASITRFLSTIFLPACADQIYDPCTLHSPDDSHYQSLLRRHSADLRRWLLSLNRSLVGLRDVDRRRRKFRPRNALL